MAFKTGSSGTAQGILALALWSFSALLATSISAIPLFQMLSVVFSISFMVILFKVALFKEWHKLKQPWLVWLIGFCGIYGNDVFYYEAFKFAPPTQIDLINYLWPMLIIPMAMFFNQDKLNWRYFLGCLISFAGVFYLISHDADYQFSTQYWLGYGMAFIDAFFWAIYVLVCSRHKHLHAEAIGAYCGLAAICSMAIHHRYESYVTPTSKQWFSMVLIGIFSQALAYVMWEQGIRRGNYKVLSIASYFTPAASIVVLIIFGQAQFSMALVIACLMVILGLKLAR